MMRELNKKYIQNIIISEELHQLRTKINKIDNNELERVMQHDWDSFRSDVKAPKRCFNNIQHSVRGEQSQKETNNTFNRFLFNSLKIASVVVFMLIASYALYLHKEMSEMTTQITTISTNRGEKTTVSLPDGSSVVLNELSTLSFNPTSFNNEQRVVEFEGEGYFDIQKSPQQSFLINSDTISVKVLGTLFNLLSRKNVNIVELELLEGCVEFNSLLDSTTYKLSPLQKVIYNKARNNTKIIDFNKKKISSWREERLIFKAAELSAVLAAIEDVYHVDIEIIGKVDAMSDLFTGAIARDNVEEAISTIEKVYHLDAAIAGGNIYLKAKEY